MSVSEEPKPAARPDPAAEPDSGQASREWRYRREDRARRNGSIRRRFRDLRRRVTAPLVPVLVPAFLKLLARTWRIRISYP